MSPREIAYDRIGQAIAGMPANSAAEALADHLSLCIVFAFNDVDAAKECAIKFGQSIAENVGQNWKGLKDMQLAVRPAGGSA
jgi:hypothetical protein